MMSSRSFTSAFVLAALVVASEPAAAQAPPGPATASKPTATARAEAAYKEGVRLGSEKKWPEAEIAFREAWTLNPTVDVAYNLGSVEYRLGKYRDAAEHLSFALRTWPLMEAMAKQRPLAEQRLKESRTFLGSLTIMVDVANAEVFVDGQAAGKAPLPGEVFVTSGGPHTVEAKAEGYGAAKETFSIEKGATRTIDLKLSPLPKSNGLKPIEPAGPGDGGPQTPPEGNGGKATVEGGPSKPLIIAGIASSAVLVGAGAVFAIVSSVNASEAEKQRTATVKPGMNPCLAQPLTVDCASIRDSLTAKDTFGNLSVFSFVLGGTAAVGTVVYALVAPKSKPKSGVNAVPVVSANAGGVVITGHW